MGNGKVIHGNPTVIRNLGKLKPVLSKEVKKLLQNNPDKKLIRQSFIWLHYEKVTIKEYEYVLKKIKQNKKS
ncbi:hypothetical protein [Sulfurimonas paralvinellae]|uniref:Uncharacterized protein n=1 Tax=Sulfurimonas paralvinellae TaxID=317658 RepID=A0A7M1B8U9_9BACT|nr:hypothetical protein [Sulfurimonas paralvinellae]QOP46051.1 hypothetical protein FM071_06965 [Sulfurimonas paralvinellae]